VWKIDAVGGGDVSVGVVAVGIGSAVGVATSIAVSTVRVGNTVGDTGGGVVGSAVVDVNGDVVGKVGDGDVIVVVLAGIVDVDVDVGVVRAATSGTPILRGIDAPASLEIKMLAISILTVIWAGRENNTAQ